MKKLRANRLDDTVTVAFEGKEGDTCHIILRKAGGKWKCPVMAYTKLTGAGYTAVFGLRQGWEPTAAMIKVAEKALKA